MSRGYVKVVRGSIFDQDVDVIVSPANERLRNAGGLAAEVERRAGIALRNECREITKYLRVATGNAVSTTAGDLPFKRVVHAVGPVYDSARPGECRSLLASATLSALRSAHEEGYRRIALPAISCGIFGYPVDLAAPVCVDVALRASRSPAAMQVVFCLPDDRGYKAFRKALWRQRWRRQ